MLSNLLQELTIASRFGRHQIILDEARLNENPVNRMKRLISTQFWKSLTREVTKDNIVDMSKDTKIKNHGLMKMVNFMKIKNLIEFMSHLIVLINMNSSI